MNTQKIIDHLQKEVDWKTESLKRMDKRHKIPKRITNEITELKLMIEYLIICHT